MTAIPDGFVRLPEGITNAWTSNLGPLFVSLEAEEVVFGFRVDERHLNLSGACHGGALSSFADFLMPAAAIVKANLSVSRTATVSLSVDFMEPGRVGTWVEGRGKLLKATRSLLFVQAITSGDGEPLTRSSGVYKMLPPPYPDPSLASLVRAALNLKEG